MILLSLSCRIFPTPLLLSNLVCVYCKPVFKTSLNDNNGAHFADLWNHCFLFYDILSARNLPRCISFDFLRLPQWRWPIAGLLSSTVPTTVVLDFNNNNNKIYITCISPKNVLWWNNYANNIKTKILKIIFENILRFKLARSLIKQVGL